MSWKEIVVSVKPQRIEGPYLSFAAQLAARFKARLTAVYALSDLALLKEIFAIRDPELVAKRSTDAYLEAARAEEAYRAFVAREGLECDWYVGEGDPAQVMVLAGRAADLIVLEQRVPGAHESAWHVAEEAALMTGTPAIVVPREVSHQTIGRRLLVAWNGSREAAGAVGAAMPLVDSAESIVLAVGKSEERFGTVTRRPDVTIERRLAQHNTAVERIEFAPARGEEGRELLATAHRHRCDMIVMGAYGRSRVREWLLGGATRDVLAQMDLPVLFGR
jgi:nucleotide-binding universal stress UspA family protein